MATGTIKAICLSEKRGTLKRPVESALLIEDYGLENDAHAGKWHRQVSLLSLEKIEAFRKRGAMVSFGDFGENFVVEGFDFIKLPVGTHLRCGDALLEMTQHGKQCHAHCAIYQAVGDCIMPREGVFARVLKGGKVKPGDTMTLVPTAGIITCSDKGSTGDRVDLAGPAIREILEQHGYEVLSQTVLPDDRQQISNELIRLCDETHVSVIFTTGGTGFSPRDITPEATLDVIERACPGIPEAMRQYSLTITPRAMLSRAVAGIRGQTLIVNLPGSPKAVKESLGYLLPALDHGIEILLGADGECARKEK